MVSQVALDPIQTVSDPKALLDIEGICDELPGV